MSKWTPGQWEVKDWGRLEPLDGAKVQFMVRVFDPIKPICYCGSESDARLIAAAPEMAELLASAIQVLEARAPDFNELNGNIRALLEKVNE